MKNNYIEQRVLDVADYILKTGSTVRHTAKIFGVSKSTIHVDMTKRLPILNLSKSKKVRKVLDFNLSQRSIRGGIATKNKYSA